MSKGMSSKTLDSPQLNPPPKKTQKTTTNKKPPTTRKQKPPTLAPTHLHLSHDIT